MVHSRLEKLPDNVITIGSHAHTDNHKEKILFEIRLPMNRCMCYIFSSFIMCIQCIKLPVMKIYYGLNFLAIVVISAKTLLD